MTAMKLKRLNITQDWGQDNIYSGEIEFESKTGCVAIKLDDTLSRRLFAICADEIILAAQRMLTAMPKTMAETQKLLASDTPNAEFTEEGEAPNF